jgi:hypothetical protein
MLTASRNEGRSHYGGEEREMFEVNSGGFGFEMLGDGDGPGGIAARRRRLRVKRIATSVMAAGFLMAGLSACSEGKNPEDPIEGKLVYKGTVAHEVIVIDNGKKVDCAVAAANGVSLTCDWAGAH